MTDMTGTEVVEAPGALETGTKEVGGRMAGGGDGGGDSPSSDSSTRRFIHGSADCGGVYPARSETTRPFGVDAELVLEPEVGSGGAGGGVVSGAVVSTSPPRPPTPNSALNRRKYDGRPKPMEVEVVSDVGFLIEWAMPGRSARSLLRNA